jgi:hypothetical protein
MDNNFNGNARDLDDPLDNLLPQPAPNVTPASLKLVAKKIPLKYAEYRISNCSNKMIATDSISISGQGILFGTSIAFPRGALMRVWIEMPDYWARKSRHVGYRHTEAPTFFQLLARVVNCEETGKRNVKFHLLCQTVNLDPVDELVLHDYLGLPPPSQNAPIGAFLNQGGNKST